MEKDYEAFVEELRQALLTATGYEESRIYLKKGEDYPQTAGDRIFVECGGGEYSREVCGLYARELYECYINGTTIREIVQQTRKDLDRIKGSGILEKARYLENYEKIKSELFIRPLNSERNRKELKNCIYREIGDIALVLYMRMGKFDGVISSFKVRQDMVERWGQDRTEVFDRALVNTGSLTPPRIYKWEKLIFDPDYCGDDFMNTLTDFPLKKDSVGNCLSTSERTNGAVAIFLPGVAERLGNLMGSGFYMVFTSIHEVMIHKESEVKVEELRGVLRDTIKEATPETDVLTLKIYHYDRETGAFTWE